ncbi:MAG: ABC transporter permease [Propionibacteriaceae bacterium]|nr:ABC transporter permease [Propionibacteriaceae bacterium]
MLALVQARFQLREAFRIPISIIMGLFAPSIGLLFFILPQRAISNDTELATQSVVGLAVFGIMVNSLFQFAVEVSQARERPWGGYTQTLPAGAGSRILSYLMSSGVLAAFSVVPLLVLAALTTAATLSPPRLLIGLGALLVTSIPFMLLGLVVGHLFNSKAAVAVAQVLMMVLAFGGGLFIPPSVFPRWMDILSMALPTRSALEIVQWATNVGGQYLASSIVGLLGWTAGLGFMGLVLAASDTDKEYRS